MLKGSPTSGNVNKGKIGKVLCWVQLLVQCIIPNSDGRGQGHEMFVCVAQTVQKVAVRGATVRHDGNLVSVSLPPHAPGCTDSFHVRLEWYQSDTLVDELECGLRSSSLPR